MTRDAAVRWVIATIALLAVAALGTRVGHGRALLVMLLLLAFVAVFGGTRRHD